MKAPSSNVPESETDSKRDPLTDDPDHVFFGDPDTSRRRLKELTAIACDCLSVQTLNRLAFTIAAGLDMDLGSAGCGYAKQFEQELDAEQTSVRRRQGFLVLKGGKA